MLNKLLDEPHFSGLEEDIKKGASLYPTFLRLMSHAKKNSVSHSDTVRKLLTFPEEDRRLKDLMTNRTLATLPEVLEWAESNLEAIKTSYTTQIDYLLRSKGRIVPEEIRLKYETLENVSDVRMIHDYFMLLTKAVEGKSVGYDFSKEEGLYWEELREMLKPLGERLREEMYSQKNHTVPTLFASLRFLRSHPPGYYPPLEREELERYVSELDLRNLKKQMVEFTFRRMTEFRQDLLYRNDWIIKEKNLDKIMELILSL